MKIPVIDLAECTDCEGCIDLCPDVFVRNDAGYIEVKELEEYPEEAVNEVIMNCPTRCISWEEV